MTIIVFVMIVVVMGFLERVLEVVGCFVMMRFVMLHVGGMMLGVPMGLEIMLVVRCFGIERLGLRSIGLGMLDDVASNAIVAATAARTAMARASAAGAVLALFLGLAVRALVSLDQRLTVGNRDLIVIWMDFAEGQEAMAVPAIFDEGGLKRRLYPRDLGEIDIAAQLLALGGFEIKFFDAIAADHDDPGLFRVSGIDQHFVRHFATLGGGGRVCP